MSYVDEIRDFEKLTLDDMINLAIKHVPTPHIKAPWFYPGMDHGKALLSTEDQLICYLAAYGEMHKMKLEEAFTKFPFNEFEEDIEIIDWGCGQGIASVFLIEKLRDKGLTALLKKITLIEPSKSALERASCHVNQSIINNIDAEVELINKFLPGLSEMDNEVKDLLIEEKICVHLFSNILDIPSIDLKRLTSLIAKTGYRHYFVCVGPYGPGKERLEGFFRYFNVNPGEIFHEYSKPSYKQIQNGKWFGCVTKVFKLIREEGKPFLIPLSFYPPREFAAAYQLDEFGKIETNSLPDTLKCFDALAPFDIGARVYEDVDPVLAVLNNIITRGLPSRCSPFVQNEFMKAFCHSSRIEENGHFYYKTADNQIVEENNELFQKSPVGIAWIQKLIVEALITGKLSFEDTEWKIVVVEDKFPCAALAIEDLRMIFDNLCLLSQDYNDRKFPKVILQIVNSENKKSSLHLGQKVVTSKKKINKEETYDMVIEISFDQIFNPESIQFSEFKVKNDCYFKICPSSRIAKRNIFTSDLIKYNQLTELERSGTHRIIEENAKILKFFLQLLFRKLDFRAGQLPILNRALQNKSVIGLLPTGGGKSLTYQLAAMLQPGITVIIDPLKSLMMDQYEGLKANGIDACTYINADLDNDEKDKRANLMENSEIIFIFMTPERLCSYDFRERLRNMKEFGVYFSYGVIDEVHCVSEWGHDFRPSYLHLGRNLYNYVRAKEGKISLFGLTATASFDVLSDVERELSGKTSFSLDPETIVRYENTNRLELQYKIERIEAEFEEEKSYRNPGILDGCPLPVNLGNTYKIYLKKRDRLKDIINNLPENFRELLNEKSVSNILESFKNRETIDKIINPNLKPSSFDHYLSKQPVYDSSGIIFCPHKGGSREGTGVSVKNIYNVLKDFTDIGYYHGGEENLIDDVSCIENLSKFRNNDLGIMVATKAFGMGIDKPNVRFTINMNYSSSLEAFVQEAGRAGRDQKLAIATILLTDYELARIKHKDPNKRFNSVIHFMENHWYRKKDIEWIIKEKNIDESEYELEICNPINDFIKIKCKSDVPKLHNGEVVHTEFGPAKKHFWVCESPEYGKDGRLCSRYKKCQIRKIDKSLRYKWHYLPDFQKILKQNRIQLRSEEYTFSNPDYETLMFFYDQNFLGENIEKNNINNLLFKNSIEYFIGNDSEDKKNKLTENGFLRIFLNQKIGEEIVVFIQFNNDEESKEISKTIFRMCMIGLVDDFTQKYINTAKGYFRIVAKRKKPGEYYQNLKLFLTKYYSEEKAENEVEKASIKPVKNVTGFKGETEIFKCISYLTEFVYEKIALKRKRAIDDMRNFCLNGIQANKDWKEINEELKDDIYFYFNSKFARSGYLTENNEPFSLKDDIEKQQFNNFASLYKYMRVTDPDVAGNSGASLDQIKHLRGAVRLIRRAQTDYNPMLDLLNVFCLAVLWQKGNSSMMEEMKTDFVNAYEFIKQNENEYPNAYQEIRNFVKEFNIKDRNLANSERINFLKQWILKSDIRDLGGGLEDFTNKYT